MALSIAAPNAEVASFGDPTKRTNTDRLHTLAIRKDFNKTVLSWTRALPLGVRSRLGKHLLNLIFFLLGAINCHPVINKV